MPDPSPTQGVRKIVVALLGAIGDVLLSTPLLESLRIAFPDARITYLVGASAAPVLKNLPLIDDCIVLAEDPTRQRMEDLRVFLQLLRGRFDLGICLTRADKLALMLWLSRIPLRVGYDPTRFSRLFTHLVDSEETRFSRLHRTAYFLAAGEQIGVQAPTVIRLHYQVSAEERAWARSVLNESGARREETLVVIHPGTSKIQVQKRRWAISNFIDVARHVLGQSNRRLVLVGNQEEAEELSEFRSAGLQRVIDLGGKLDLRQLAAILEQCSILVHNDSSPLHLAVAVGTPVLAVFGYQNQALWGPLGPRNRLVRRDLPCSPCLPEFPCDREFECIRRLEPSTVIRVLDQMLMEIGQTRERS